MSCHVIAYSIPLHHPSIHTCTMRRHSCAHGHDWVTQWEGWCRSACRSLLVAVVACLVPAPRLLARPGLQCMHTWDMPSPLPMPVPVTRGFPPPSRLRHVTVPSQFRAQLVTANESRSRLSQSVMGPARALTVCSTVTAVETC